jgi:hypothetical protein
MDARKKTAQDYGWVTARLTEDNRDLVENLRAESGLRSLSATIEMMIDFVERGNRQAFLDHAVASRAVAGRKAGKASPHEPGEALGPLPRPVAPPAAAPVAAPAVEAGWDADFTGY